MEEKHVGMYAELLRKVSDKLLYDEVNRRDAIRQKENEEEAEVYKHLGIKQPVPGQYNVVCSSCQKATTVPFKPRDGWPVYCVACYKERKKGDR